MAAILASCGGAGRRTRSSRRRRRDRQRRVRQEPAGDEVGDGDQLHPRTATGRRHVRHRALRAALVRCHDPADPRLPRLGRQRGPACSPAIRRSTPTTPTGDLDVLAERGHGRRQATASSSSWRAIRARSRARPRATRASPASTSSRRAIPRNLKLITFHAAAHGPHDDLHQRLRLPLDRRAGGVELPEGGARLGRRPADHRDRHPRPEAPGHVAATVDLFRNDGVTAYSHDVQVDGEGIAWVSGAGGVRGYWTEGTHVDPRDGLAREASRDRADPVRGRRVRPRRGRAPSEFMHNAFRAAGDECRRRARRAVRLRPVEADPRRPRRRRAAGLRRRSASSRSRRSRAPTTARAGSRRRRPPFRLKVIGTWNPHEQEGTLVNDTIYCSAHYFDCQERDPRVLVVRPGHALRRRVGPRRTRSRSRTTGPTTGLVGALLPPRLRLSWPTTGAASTSSSWGPARVGPRAAGAEVVQAPPAARQAGVARRQARPAARLDVPARHLSG